MPDPGQPPLRFNWVPPIRLSPHNSQILYAGAQVLLRSLDRGDHWQEISPDLTANDEAKTFGRGNIQFCTITTISESPVTPGVIWVGTDDGNVQVTQDDGKTWAEVQKVSEGLDGLREGREPASSSLVRTQGGALVIVYLLQAVAFGLFALPPSPAGLTVSSSTPCPASARRWRRAARVG